MRRAQKFDLLLTKSLFALRWGRSRALIAAQVRCGAVGRCAPLSRTATYVVCWSAAVAECELSRACSAPDGRRLVCVATCAVHAPTGVVVDVDAFFREAILSSVADHEDVDGAAGGLGPVSAVQDVKPLARGAWMSPPHGRVGAADRRAGAARPRERARVRSESTERTTDAASDDERREGGARAAAWTSQDQSAALAGRTCARRPACVCAAV